MVERHLAKVDVAGPTPVFRSKLRKAIQLKSEPLFFYNFELCCLPAVNFI